MKTFYIILFAFAIISCNSSQKKNENNILTEFPIAGTWYVNDNGENFTNNALNFSEYTFGEPDQSGGKLLGKIKLVSFDGEEREGEFEILDENKIIIYLLYEQDYTFTYTYFPEEQNLEMNFAGQERTLVREKPAAETTSFSSDNKFQQTLEILEKIGGVTWRSKSFTNRYSKPTKEGDNYTGELFEKSDSGWGYVHKYELTSDGEFNIRIIRRIYGDEEIPIGITDKSIYEKFELSADEKTLIIKIQGSSEIIYQRK